MGNTINTASSVLNYKNVGQTPKRAKGDASAKREAKDPFAKYGATVELSDAGLAALTRERQKDGVDDGVGRDGGTASAEQKLSPKAQDFLKKLREKYGDYDIIAAEKIDDPLGMTRGSTKEYSVILTNDEIEKMAEDEEYADEVMKKVESAVGMAKSIEEKGELGEGVRFSHIAISFDNDGNMKLFAELEKMSEQRQERMEKAKEKRAEEKKKAADPPHEKKEPPVKRIKLEAASEEELLEKLSKLNWDEIEDDGTPLKPHGQRPHPRA